MLSAFTNPSDTQLFEEVRTLSHRERQATARLIACLAEVDARRLYRGEGCSSLFTYCTQILHLSEHAAYMRIEAARAARRFPVILASASASERQSPIVLPPRPPKRPAVMAPIAPEQYKIQMTVSRDTYEKLRRAQDLIRHMVPNADPAAIFERALTLFFVGSRNGRCTLNEPSWSSTMSFRMRLVEDKRGQPSTSLSNAQRIRGGVVLWTSAHARVRQGIQLGPDRLHLMAHVMCHLAPGRLHFSRAHGKRRRSTPVLPFRLGVAGLGYDGESSHITRKA